MIRVPVAATTAATAIAVATLALGTSACSVKRGAGLEDVREAVHARAGDVPVRWDQGTPADAEARARVRDLLVEPLTVESAVAVALLNNRSIQAVYEELGIAQADLVEAGLLRNPVIAGSARFTERGEPRPSLSIAHEVLSLLMLPARKKLARAEWEQQKLRVAHEVLELASEVKAAWFEAKSAELAATLQGESTEAAAAGAELAGRQFEAGNVSALQLALEEDFAEQSKLDLAGSEEEAFTARERLNRLLGVWGGDTGWTLAADLPPIPAAEPPLTDLEAVAIRRRLDLEADRQAAALVARALGTTRAWRFVPGLEVGVEVEDEGDGQYLAGPHVAITLPIFDWGQTRVARLEAQHRKAANELVARAVEIRSDVRVSRDRLLRARARVEHYRETLIPLRERIVQLTQLHYNAMLLGPRALLDAKRGEIEARRAWVLANRDYWLARTGLERAAGGSLETAHPDTAGETR